MDYKTFIDSFSKVKDFSLPGLSAQLRAAPPHRLKEIPLTSADFKNAKKAAVLLYCYPKANQMQLSLIKRTDYGGVHSGQISLPGGKPEQFDATLQDTALRECKEELGIPLQTVQDLVPLTPLYIPPSNFLVSPYITYESRCPDFFPDSREVAAHIELPLFKLMELELEQREIPDGPFHGSPVPCYLYEGHMVWGATAMILTEFKVVLTALNSN
jgi:8-oxo-dGTP pyrophosphatase MutT (NUDIX family)